MEEKNLNEMEKFRQNMKRKRRRRALRFAFLSLLVMIVACAFVKFFFSVATVRVTNRTPYETSDLVNDGGVLPGRMIFSLNAERIKENLGKKYPYVADVEIDITLPSTVAVTFTEGRRVWRFESDGGYIYLSDGMVILEKNEILYEDTIKVTGMNIGEVYEGDVFSVENSIEFKVLSDIIKALDSHGMRDKLTSVDFTKKYNTKIYLGDRVEVELGTSEAIADKISLMLKIMERNSPEKKLLINVKNPEEGRCKELNEEEKPPEKPEENGAETEEAGESSENNKGEGEEETLPVEEEKETENTENAEE